MLAIKCISARFDSLDRDDLAFLIRYLKLPAADAVSDIVQRYYPHQLVPAKAQFLVEELFDEAASRR